MNLIVAVYSIASETETTITFRDYIANFHQSMDCSEEDCSITKFLNSLNKIFTYENTSLEQKKLLLEIFLPRKKNLSYFFINFLCIMFQ